MARGRASFASTINTAEGHQRVVEQRRAVGGIGGAALKECVEQPRHRLGREVAGDHDDPGALVSIGPALEPDRRMHHVLDPMDHQGTVRFLGDLHNALEAQDIGTAMLGERFEKEREHHSLDRFPAHDRIGFDLGIMASMRVALCRASLLMV